MSMSYQTYHRAPSFLRRIVAAVAAARVSRGARHIAADTNLGVARPYGRLSHIAPPFIRISFRQRRLPVSSHNRAVARLCPRIVLGALGEMPAASVRARIDAQAEIARLLGVCPRLFGILACVIVPLAVSERIHAGTGVFPECHAAFLRRKMPQPAGLALVGIEVYAASATFVVCGTLRIRFARKNRPGLPRLIEACVAFHHESAPALSALLFFDPPKTSLRKCSISVLA